MSPADSRTPASFLQPTPNFHHYQLLRHQFQFHLPTRTPQTLVPCVRYYNQLYLALVPAAVRHSTRLRRHKRVSASSARRARAPARRRHMYEDVGVSPTRWQSTASTTAAEITPSCHYQHVVPGACLTDSSEQPLLTTHPASESSSKTIERKNTRQPTERGITTTNVSSIPASVRQVIGARIPGADVKEILRVERFSKIRPVSMIRIERSEEEWCEDGVSRVVALVFPHNRSFRLLRSEQWLFRSEGLVLKWLGDTLGGQEENLEGKRASEDGSQMGGEENQQEMRDPLRRCGVQVEEILDYLPRLLHHSETAENPLRSEYTLISTLPGIPLSPAKISPSSLPTPTSSPATAKMSANAARDIPSPATHPKIAGALGTLYQRLANLNSPNGKFGPAAAVLSEPDPDRLLAGAQGMMYSGGAQDWKTAFHSLLEGVLRDGEDMTITLPYTSLRTQMSRLKDVFNRVTEPRLCLADVPGEAICVVTDDGGKHRNPNTFEADATDSETGSAQGAAAAEGGDMKLSGISDWSTAFFGDPLLSTAFTAAIPSADATDNKGFLAGFAGISADKIDALDPLTWASSPTCPIDDPANAKARLLLYAAFHATAAVVREYYRQTNESSRLELAARKRLNGILAELQEVNLVDNEQVEGQESGNVKGESKRKCNNCGDGNQEVGNQDNPSQSGSGNIERKSSCKLSPAKKLKVESTK